MVVMHAPASYSCSDALKACLESSVAACTARKLGETVAHACRDSLLRAESLIQLGLLPKPHSHTHPVPHVRQAYNWDCGLACVLMVLRAAGIHGEDFTSLCDLCSITSIWTVDLAYLLRRFGLEVELTTITIGANPDYAKESFYKEHMAEDGSRVERLFQEAATAGITVSRRSVGCRELKDRMLMGGVLVIALVDKTRLAGHTVSAVALPAVNLGLTTRLGIAPAYTGHYIVICGYDCETDRFMIQDPASTAEMDSVPTCSLEAARHAYGTDEDLLLVTMPSSPYMASSVVHF
ncbi:Protein GUCD1 [Coccomyxa sp. Obi]|nr:Protein GUCD1 [Coccomyxa sp. Obi]